MAFTYGLQASPKQPLPDLAMPRGDNSSDTAKQKRQAQHVEDGENTQGRSTEAAERIAWTTVNKQDGGGATTAATSTTTPGNTA